MRNILGIFILIGMLSGVGYALSLDGYGLKFSGNHSAAAPHVVIGIDGNVGAVIAVNAMPNQTGYSYVAARIKNYEVGFTSMGALSSANFSKITDVGLFKTSAGIAVYPSHFGFECSVYLPVLF